ncbi:MAG: potassium transporter [Planctomycetaceae bacterium]|nr:potassium transporter [Planctomycetaceae bacterium]
MRIKAILHILGGLMLATGGSMLLPIAFSLYYGDSGLMPLITSLLITAGVGGVLLWLFRSEFQRATSLNQREGAATVAVGWAAACLLGALPYEFAGVFPTFADAAFESFSGFSTTGSSVMVNIEAVAPGILLWRSMTHWLGGMGIIVLSLAILPYLGVGGMQLYKAEVPGPTPDKLTPRLKDTAKILWQVYILMTVAQVCFLSFGEMSFFEALAHTFGSVATGGFSTRNASLGAFSPYTQWVCIVFMFLAGVNFVLHFNVLRGLGRLAIRDEEFRFYLVVTVTVAAMVCITVMPSYPTVEEAVRASLFQVVSILTTTGFATADFEVWPPLAQGLLLLLMIMGGSAGSTAGGLKCMRVLVLAKHLYHEIFYLVHPRAVRLIKFNRATLPASVINGCVSFVTLYVLIWATSTILVAATGADLATSASAALTCLSNVGPGFGSIGPAENFAHLAPLAKWVLSLDMLLGRLELFTLLVLCFPEFWRR